MSYFGLDYCQEQLAQFQKKRNVVGSRATLIFGDARDFDLVEQFNLIFIGFSSLSEVVESADKARLMQGVRAHLAPNGWFTFSLHNPAVRSLKLHGQKGEPLVCDFNDGHRTLEFRSQLDPPSPTGIVSGKQFYVIKDRDGRILDERQRDEIDLRRFALTIQSQR